MSTKVKQAMLIENGVAECSGPLTAKRKALYRTCEDTAGENP